MLIMRTGIAPIRIQTGCYGNLALTSAAKIRKLCGMNEPEIEEQVIIRGTQ